MCVWGDEVNPCGFLISLTHLLSNEVKSREIHPSIREPLVVVILIGFLSEGSSLSLSLFSQGIVKKGIILVL